MGLEGRIWASRLGFGPRGWDFGREAGILALRLGLWASRLRFRSKVLQGGEVRTDVRNGSPLWGRCPKRRLRWRRKKRGGKEKRKKKEKKMKKKKK